MTAGLSLPIRVAFGGPPSCKVTSEGNIPELVLPLALEVKIPLPGLVKLLTSFQGELESATLEEDETPTVKSLGDEEMDYQSLLAKISESPVPTTSETEAEFNEPRSALKLEEALPATCQTPSTAPGSVSAGVGSKITDDEGTSKHAEAITPMVELRLESALLPQGSAAPAVLRLSESALSTSPVMNEDTGQRKPDATEAVELRLERAVWPHPTPPAVLRLSDGALATDPPTSLSGAGADDLELISDLDSQNQSQSNTSGPASTPAAARNDVTTMMLRNVPKHLSQADLVSELNTSGFTQAFDFCYLPRHFESPENRGYAFVNFVTPANALMFQRAWQNREIRTVGCAPALISVSHADVQGLQANMKKWCGPRLRRIRNPSLLPYMAPHVLASTAEQQLRPNLPAVRDVAVHVGGVSDWTTMHDEGLAPPSLPLPPSWSATSDLDIALAGEAARWLLKDESSW